MTKCLGRIAEHARLAREAGKPTPVVTHYENAAHELRAALREEGRYHAAMRVDNRERGGRS